MQEPRSYRRLQNEERKENKKKHRRDFADIQVILFPVGGEPMENWALPYRDRNEVEPRGLLIPEGRERGANEGWGGKKKHTE